MKRLPFSEEMYRAAIEGRKTVTRRVKTGDRPPYTVGEIVGLTLPHWRMTTYGHVITEVYVYDDVTKRMREVVEAPGVNRRPVLINETVPHDPIEPPDWRHLPAMLMPAWACLHFARIVGVREERLQDITPAEVLHEGLVGFGIGCAIEAYAALWDRLNAKRGYPWESNPDVWRIEFNICERPE